jgi:sugar phosphate permease
MAAPPEGPKEDASPRHRGQPQHRFVMPALLSFQPTTNWIIRNAINTLIPFICREQGFSEDQRAMLLAAFYPGYVGAHIPGGILVQRWGGKAMLTINMYGSALVCALLPLAVRVKPALRAPALAALLAALGVMQGPLIPSLQTMRKDWIPRGPGRALALRLQDLGGTLTGVVYPLLPPLIAMRYGWKAFFGGYAVFCGLAALVWQRNARDRPPSMGSAPVRQAVDWRVFLEPRVLAMITAQIGSGFAVYVMGQWQPIYFTEELGATPMAAAVLFAWNEAAVFVCDWSVALLETALERRGTPRLLIRKLSTLIGAFGGAVSMAAFVNCRTPIGAAVASYFCSGFYCFHHSGFGANLLEVGGTQTAMLNAVNNMLKSAAGIVCPPL